MGCERLISWRVEVFGIPLVINKSTGKKFGKSEGGAVWLDSAKTSVYQFYQFWLNVDDLGVVDYLKVYTFLSREEIGELEAQQQAHPEARPAQRRLAEEVTKLVHGEAALAKVQRVTEVLFGGRAVSELDSDELDLLSAEIKTVELTSELTVSRALLAGGVASSNGEARRLIQGGGVSVNGVKLATDRSLDRCSLIRKGKNRFVLVR